MQGKIKNFYNQHVNKTDRLILLFILLMLGGGLVCTFVNKVGLGYLANQYLPGFWVFLLPFMLSMLFVAWWAKGMSPRLSHFTRFYTLYYLIILSWGVLINGIQLTPFAPIDKTLLGWDQVLHINTAVLIAWTAHHPTLKTLFIMAYNFITLQLFFLPALLALFKNQTKLNEYLFLVILISLFSALIYYFFPTAAPSSVIHSAYFLPDQHDTALKFYQIHHHLLPTTTQGGLIAFPSDHVMFALMCIYVVRNRLWLLIPVSVINLVGILSTVMLGWHYLVDVIASGLIFALCLYLLKYLPLTQSFSPIRKLP